MPWTRCRVHGSFMDQVDRDQQSIEGHMQALAIDDGRSVRVFDMGQGDPIILLPMTTELNFVYAPQIEEFASDHRVILYEPRLSSQSHVGIADRANEAVSLLNRLGLESARNTSSRARSDNSSICFIIAYRAATIK